MGVRNQVEEQVNGLSDARGPIGMDEPDEGNERESFTVFTSLQEMTPDVRLTQ